MAKKGQKKGRGSPLLLLFLFVAGLFSFYLGFRSALPVGPVRAAGREQPAPSPHPSVSATPRPTPRSTPGATPTPTPAAVTPKAAIIIDDFGNSYEEAEAFINARIPLTLSVLPQLPYSARIAENGKARGKTILVHMPMEPLSDKNPGPGTIKTDMADADIAQLVGTNLDTVPGAVGVNNHEGSKATQDHRVMRIMLEIMRARRLFYVDSMTTMASAGPSEAKRIGVRFAVRNVFLDNEEDDDLIKNQIKVLIQNSKEHGEAIGIGHVKERTLRCILDMVPTFEAEGVKLVDIQELVR